MRQIKLDKMTKDNFYEFGEFFDMIHPDGENMGSDFYPEKIRFTSMDARPVTFSSYIVEKAEKMIIRDAEFHNDTSEMILPLDGDIAFYVAPVSKELEPDRIRAFHIPQGTAVRLFPGVWHKECYGLEGQVHILIGLTERTYARDCVVIPIPEEEQIEIIR